MGNNLKKLREEREMSQLDVSKTLKINPSTLSKLESGITNLSDTYAIALADFYHVTLDELFNRNTDHLSLNLRNSITNKKVDYYAVISSLNTLTTKELISLYGAIDVILESRSNNQP